MKKSFNLILTLLILSAFSSLSGCLTGANSSDPVRSIVPADSLMGQLTGAEIYDIVENRVIVFSAQPKSYHFQQQGQGIVNNNQSNSAMLWTVEENKICVKEAALSTQDWVKSCYAMLLHEGDFILLDEAQETHYIYFRELS